MKSQKVVIVVYLVKTFYLKWRLRKTKKAMLKIKDIAITLIMVIHALTKKMVVCSSTKCLLSVNFMHLVAKITKSRSKLRHSQSFLLVLILGQAEQRCTHVRIVGCLYYTVQLSGASLASL